MPYDTAFEFLTCIPKQEKNRFVMQPEFSGYSCPDLMFAGGAFYAILDPETGLWTSSEDTARRLIDKEIVKAANNYMASHPDADAISPLTIGHDSTTLNRWMKYEKSMPTNYHNLDEKLTFYSDKVTKEMYRSKRLPYDLWEGDTPCWDRLMDVVYGSERRKIEYAIGSIVDGPHISSVQKYYIFYGEGGSGKSTVINILDKVLFPDYCARFSANELASGGQFPAQSLASNPLVAYDHEARLGNLQDNSMLNSIGAGETISMNIKHLTAYPARLTTTMFMAANEAPKITNRNAGSVRRIIDISPTGNKVDPEEYDELMEGIEREAGAIAWKCKQVYLENPRYYKNYEPRQFMRATDPMYDFMLEYSEDFIKAGWVSENDTYIIYKSWCESCNETPKTRKTFGEEFKPYWRNFYQKKHGKNKVYEDLITDKIYEQTFSGAPTPKKKEPKKLILDQTTSILDEMLADCPAQYGIDEKPSKAWDTVTTTLKCIDTSQLHYVRPGEHHIVIDLDLKVDGEKSAELNLERAAALPLPETYCEFSKSGQGVHMHYIYDGDPTMLKSLYEPNVEIKVYSGKSSLRRKLTYCNNKPVAHLHKGSLPEKDATEMIDTRRINNEIHLRNCVKKALSKDMAQPYTSCCIDYIAECLDNATKSGIHYDLRDLRPAIEEFARGSSNQRDKCIKTVMKMKFTNGSEYELEDPGSEGPLMIFDFEVFPNFNGCALIPVDKDNDSVHILINPTPIDIAKMSRYKLIGFNNIGYDDYIAQAILRGYPPEEVYELSKLITDSKRSDEWAMVKRDPMFKAGFSYADIYDYSSTKKGLKKFEIDMLKDGMDVEHDECEFPWDQPVEPANWHRVMEYCANDVRATKALFWTPDRQKDWKARLILSEMAGMPPKTSTNNLTKRIIFDGNRSPQAEFKYRNLAEPCEDKPYFPGYKFEYNVEKKKYISSYRDVEEVGEGGYVWAKPGLYAGTNIYTFDVASMHPSSIEAEQLFGPRYTPRFSAIKQMRVYIKHGDLDGAKRLANETLGLDGRIDKYLNDKKDAKGLSQALKIAINSVYGLTSAKFTNEFKDPRNVDNIVAKRGALFMIDLRNELWDRGVEVVHIKTDSIKVVDPSPEIYDFIMDFGKRYGYTFEIEHVFRNFCLVNNAVYIGQLSTDDPEYADYVQSHGTDWTATGAQFAVPYVFKNLFSHQPVGLYDYIETKSVTKGSMYLIDNDRQKYVGRTGAFVAARDGYDLMRVETDKTAYVTGTKGHKWMEFTVLKSTATDDQDFVNRLDLTYYDGLVDDAVKAINKAAVYHGDINIFFDN